MREANAAKERALRTGSAIVRLLQELGRPGLDERERAETTRKIDRLRAQQRHEMEPIKAFNKEQERKGKEYEHALRLKDPEIERMREEMGHVLESKSKNEREEIKRIQEDAQRRLKELAHKSQ